ncbi:MAG TPA: MSHA biogenesis protein MshK [Paucimonas sp.]|nr:MSHA biogenesis protein MshK [Paucimonas sp.]
MLAGAHAYALGLTDPTRPPASLATDKSSAEMSSKSGGPVLQSVLISKARVEAIIDGAVVKVGDKVGEALVERIAEDGVALRYGKEVRMLKLYPDVEKLPIAETLGGNRESSGNKGKK